MLGRKDKQFQQHQAVCLEAIVPQKNFYRQLEATLDLTFIHALVAEQYSSRGRPSIDPVVFFKLQLVMFFEGIVQRANRLSRVGSKSTLPGYCPSLSPTPGVDLPRFRGD